MVSRIDFQKSNEVGVFLTLTNSYCLAPLAAGQQFYTLLQHQIVKSVPVIPCSIAGTRIVGRLTAGNSRGLLIPDIAYDAEIDSILQNLPESVEVGRLEERLSALGNSIVCNDSIALVNPDIDMQNEELIQDTLGVQVFRVTIGGSGLVGSYCVLNSFGGLLHPMVLTQQLEELNSLLELPLVAGTVNRGSDVIGAGLVVSDSLAVTGLPTTSNEISVIENIFNLNEEKA